jgi:hypothetical protein
MEKEIKVNLFIGTPCYNSQLHSDYLHSILDFQQHKVPVTIMTIGNESLITRARNTIISYFYGTMNYTHLLFLDADISLSAQGLIRLLSHEKDVIGAAVPLKGKNKQTGDAVYNVGKNLGEEDGLITTNKVGTAVFMLSRRAVNALVAKAVDDNDVYYPNPHTRGHYDPNIKMYDIFKVGVIDNDYLSEDYYVCKTLMDLGFNVYVDPAVMTKHSGMYVFE